MLWGNLRTTGSMGENGPNRLLGGPEGPVWGENGRDRIWAGFGLDILDGGNGDDEIISIETTRCRRDHCGGGRDRVIID